MLAALPAAAVAAAIAAADAAAATACCFAKAAMAFGGKRTAEGRPGCSKRLYWLLMGVELAVAVAVAKLGNGHEPVRPPSLLYCQLDCRLTALPRVKSNSWVTYGFWVILTAAAAAVAPPPEATPPAGVARLGLWLWF